jgi:hypothetical protein
MMARIATIEKKDLKPEDQKIYDAIAQSRGVVEEAVEGAIA